jgi:uncharacterized protein (TIGR02118 family)
MVKLLFCLRRRPELSPEEFQSYWRDHHARLVTERAEPLLIRRYVQDHSRRGAVADALRASRGAPEPFDGVAELWWDGLETLGQATATHEGRVAARELLEDERQFIDLARSPIWLAQEYEIFTS